MPDDDPPRQNFRDWLAQADLKPIAGPPPKFLKPAPEFELPPAERFGPLFDLLTSSPSPADDTPGDSANGAET